MKKILLVFFLILLSSCSNQEKKEVSQEKPYDNKVPILASIPEAYTKQELEEKSSYIIKGVVLDEISEANSSVSEISDVDIEDEEEYNYLPFYIAKIKVEKVYKGSIKHDEINIVFNSALEGRTLFHIDDEVEPPKKNAEYIFFLDNINETSRFDKEDLKSIDVKSGIYQLSFFNSGMLNSDGYDKENYEKSSLMDGEKLRILETYK